MDQLLVERGIIIKFKFHKSLWFDWPTQLKAVRIEQQFSHRVSHHVLFEHSFRAVFHPPCSNITSDKHIVVLGSPNIRSVLKFDTVRVPIVPDLYDTAGRPPSPSSRTYFVAHFEAQWLVVDSARIYTQIIWLLCTNH